MAKLGKLNKYGQEGQKIILEFEQGRAQIEVLTPYIVNVFYDPEKERVPSKAIEGSKSVSVNLALEEKKDGLWIHTGQVSVRVCDDFYVDFLTRTAEKSVWIIEGREGLWRGSAPACLSRRDILPLLPCSSVKYRR